MFVHIIEGWVLLGFTLITVVVKAFALVTAVTFAPQAYEAAGKLTKPGWLAILGIGFTAEMVLLALSGGSPNPLNIINLAFTIAALVYLFDVRPALLEVTRRRR